MILSFVSVCISSGSSCISPLRDVSEFETANYELASCRRCTINCRGFRQTSGRPTNVPERPSSSGGRSSVFIRHSTAFRSACRGSLRGGRVLGTDGTVPERRRGRQAHERERVTITAGLLRRNVSTFEFHRVVVDVHGRTCLYESRQDRRAVTKPTSSSLRKVGV